MHTPMYVQKRPRSSRASGTPRVTIRPTTPKTSDGASWRSPYGKWPPSPNSRQSTSSAAMQVPITAIWIRESRSVRRANATPTRATTRNANPSGLAASVSSAHTTKRPCRRSCSAQSASRPNANPSANGNAAETTSPADTTANVRLARRDLAPHCRRMTALNANAPVAIDSTASIRMPISAASG